MRKKLLKNKLVISACSTYGAGAGAEHWQNREGSKNQFLAAYAALAESQVQQVPSTPAPPHSQQSADVESMKTIKNTRKIIDCSAIIVNILVQTTEPKFVAISID